MRFRLVPKSMILDDFERAFSTLFQNTYVLRAHHENLNEDRPNDAVSGNIRFMRIFEGFPWRRGFKRQ